MAEKTTRDDWMDDSAFENEDEDTMKNKFLGFRIGEEDYGIEIRYVMEIVEIQKITEIPETVDYIRGVINLRGKVIPVIDVRLRFHLSMKEYDSRTCIIVVNLENTVVGLIVDSVAEVVDISEEQIAPPPMVQQTPESGFIMGIGITEEGVRILLNVRKVVLDSELEAAGAPEPGNS
ncbi:MAG: chemotaxis protein CheW [Planctomycetota bacterium]